MTARLPWRWSSTTSSPVTLAGAGKNSTSPSSIASPVARSTKRARVARRGDGTAQDKAASASRAAGPDSRMTAMPARPGAVAGAKMVSALASGRTIV
jgi:hypothetical protein